ncbi:MAG: SlyX family protein [Pseudomonadota bacterium]
MNEIEQDLQERIEALEIKSAYQEDTIDKLNTVIIEQEGRINTCERTMKLLVDKLKELQPNTSASFDQQEIPPHY